MYADAPPAAVAPAGGEGMCPHDPHAAGGLGNGASAAARDATPNAPRAFLPPPASLLAAREPPWRAVALQRVPAVHRRLFDARDAESPSPAVALCMNDTKGLWADCAVFLEGEPVAEVRRRCPCPHYINTRPCPRHALTHHAPHAQAWAAYDGGRSRIKLTPKHKVLTYEEPLWVLTPPNTREDALGHGGGSCNTLRAALANGGAARHQVVTAALWCPRLGYVLGGAAPTAYTPPTPYDAVFAAKLEALAAPAPPRGTTPPRGSPYSTAMGGMLDVIVGMGTWVQCVVRIGARWQRAWLCQAGGAGASDHALLAYVPHDGSFYTVTGVWDGQPLDEPPPGPRPATAGPSDGIVWIVNWASARAVPPPAAGADPPFFPAAAAYAAAHGETRRVWLACSGEERDAPLSLGAGGWRPDLADGNWTVIFNGSNCYVVTRWRWIGDRFVLEFAHAASANMRHKVRKPSSRARAVDARPPDTSPCAFAAQPDEQG